MPHRHPTPPGWRAALGPALVLAACVNAAPPAPPAADLKTEPGSAAANASAATTLTRVADVFRVRRDTEAISVPVDIQGVVISTAVETSSFFLHDGDMGIHVSQPGGPKFANGDWVRVIGQTRRGRYAPSLYPREIVRLGHGVFPEPRTASMAQIASGSLDSQWVEIEGVVCSVDAPANKPHMVLDLIQDGGRIRAVVSGPPPAAPEQLLDCEVRLRGIATGRFNKLGQMIEPGLRVPGLSWMTVTKAPPPDPFSVPTRTVGRLVEFSLDRQPPHRVKVQGTVTRRFTDTLFFLRDDGRGLKVEARGRVHFNPGDRIEAVGFPGIANDEIRLENAVSRVTAPGGPPAPVRVALDDLLDGSRASDLVVITARAVDSVANGSAITVIFETDNRIFAGVMQQPSDPSWRVPAKDTILDVTGICAISEVENHWSYQPRSFLLLIAGPGDLRVLQRPSWWTAARLWRALWVTLILLAAGACWVWALRRQVQRKLSLIEFQARHAAVMEERSRIARDLHDTLEQGLTGVSLQLKAVDTDLRVNPPQAHSRLQSARDMLRQSRAIAHNAIRELRVDAAASSAQGFLEILSEAAALWNHSGALTVTMAVTGTRIRLAGAVEHHLAGIGTEALTNAVKHGRATSVRIDVGFRADRSVTLGIADNGHGFNPDTVSSAGHGGYGLLGMRERAHEIGARFELRSRPGEGTTIRVELPLGATASPADGRRA